MPEIAFHIPAGHPAFAGHFPGMPITPGVVLLDQAIHMLAGQLQSDFRHCDIKSIKFLSPVLPDTHLTLHYDVNAGGTISFDIKEGQRVAASGVLHRQTGRNA
jgi:3-hydroxymyristoyl/3-hydroxydecanoyl-(acyl carrier protein) dehydratase